MSVAKDEFRQAKRRFKHAVSEILRTDGATAELKEAAAPDPIQPAIYMRRR